MNHEDYKSYDDLPLMLSVKELGAVLGISRTSAYELVHTKEIPSVKAGSRILVPKAKLIPANVDTNDLGGRENGILRGGPRALL